MKIYDSLSKQKKDLQPIEEGKVKLYVCGMTVYDYCHIGHARVLVAFDMITRYLRAKGYDVTYVRNITDIDDKIIQRAEQNQEDYTVLTERFILAMHADAKALSILPPDHEPRATHYIQAMIDLIQALLDKGVAYVADNGDVYYAVNRFVKYGCLAHQDLEKLRAGARVAVVEAKHDPLDFVLWKLAKPGEPKWASPWGAGRPGWHIECSAMSMALLGEQFDLHGGGFDLTFPHHENEIAQSEGATGKTFVRHWLHVGYLQIEQEKMSKSLGNFLTIRDVLNQYPAEVVRYFLVASHYRSPLNFTHDNVKHAQASLERLYYALMDLALENNHFDNSANQIANPYHERFTAAMDDDFNTPEALAVLFDVAHEIQRFKANDMQRAKVLAAFLRHAGNILGILQTEARAFFQLGIDNNFKQAIDTLIAERNRARAERDWVTADRVRAELAAKGIILEDSAAGTLWRRVSME